MINSVAYDRLKEEALGLNNIIKDLAARLTDEYWNYELIYSIDKLKDYIEDRPLIDLMLFDINNDSDINDLANIRDSYRQSHIMLLADMKISPMKYMKPSISAQSLLLRPFNREQAEESLREFLTNYISETYGDKRDESAAFLVETRDGKVSIPYEQIYYIEAMDKKVYICSGADEYGFYETLDTLESMLPEGFLRCHRSFIVNSGKITKVALSQNTIFLNDGYEVPLSRSYKPVFKDL